MSLFLDMSDVQYVKNWTNTAISQKTDYEQGLFWCQNYCLITDNINLGINFSPICPILDNMANIEQIQLYLSNQTMDRVGLGYCLITDINLYINSSHMNSSPICPILDNMSNIELIKLYLSKQTTNRAGFGVKMNV